MTSRIVTPALRTISRPSASMTLASTISRRTLQSSAPRLDAAAAAPVAMPIRKPVGAFRGGLFGFLLGTSLAAYGTYAYIFDEYRASNDLLTEDIYALQAAVHRLQTYISTLEEKVDLVQRKK